jgi:hypothetical protein
MNQGLYAYSTNPKIFAISGYSYPLKYLSDYEFDVAFGYRSYSWGWATWRDRWENVDWEVSDYKRFKHSWKSRLEFNRGGSDLSGMLDNQMNGRINSWMIRWVYHQYKHGLYDVFPLISKVNNIGFTAAATHTSCSQLRYLTPIDKSENREFRFPLTVEINKVIQKQVKNKFSLFRRIKYRILDKLGLSNYLLSRKIDNNVIKSHSDD